MADNNNLQEFLKNKTAIGKTRQLQETINKFYTLPPPPAGPEKKIQLDILKQRRDINDARLEESTIRLKELKRQVEEGRPLTPEQRKEMAQAEYDARMAQLEAGELAARQKTETFQALEQETGSLIPPSEEPMTAVSEGVEFWQDPNTKALSVTPAMEEEAEKARTALAENKIYGYTETNSGEEGEPVRRFTHSLTARRQAKEFLINKDRVNSAFKVMSGMEERYREAVRSGNTLLANRLYKEMNGFDDIDAALAFVDQGIKYAKIMRDSGYNIREEYEKYKSKREKWKGKFLRPEWNEDTQIPPEDKWLEENLAEFTGERFANQDERDDFIDFYMSGYGDYEYEDARGIVDFQEFPLSADPTYVEE